MEWEEHAFGKVMVLRVMARRVDVNTGYGLKRAVADVVSRQHRRLVIDLTDVQFMDSVGLNALVTCYKHVGPRGELALCGVGASVRTLLALSRMDKVFRWYEAKEDAIAAIAPAEG